MRTAAVLTVALFLVIPATSHAVTTSAPRMSEGPCLLSPPEAVEECLANIRASEADEQEEQREHEREQREDAVRHTRRERLQREWAHKPTVSESRAEEFAKRLMRTDLSATPYWEVDCRGGHIDRIRWSCSAKWVYHCLRDRIQVIGIGYRNGTPYFKAQSGIAHPCRVHY